MKLFKIIKNYFCYCGIEKDEYNAIKKDAYVSNFNVWRSLHVLMSFVFTILFITSLLVPFLKQNFLYGGDDLFHHKHLFVLLCFEETINHRTADDISFDINAFCLWLFHFF